MSPASARAERVLAESIRGLPPGLDARATEESQLPAITALMRAIDIAGCGHSSTNVDEVRDELSDPDCGWANGSATIWRREDLVAALLTYDGIVDGRGWMLDLHVRPGDLQAPGIRSALIRSAVQEGRDRWSLLDSVEDVPDPVAKSACYANDSGLRADLEWRGFVEVRRFLRMSITHVGAPTAGPPGASVDPGYTLRPYAGTEADLLGMHDVFNAAFLDHFDFTPMQFAAWREHLDGGTEDPSQWLVVEHEGRIVAFARGSNRYASEDSGYVASIAVAREHRGRGLARALLRARFADDAARGFLFTVLHVDAESPTGATGLYESVGMAADSEVVWFHRPLLG